MWLSVFNSDKLVYRCHVMSIYRLWVIWLDRFIMLGLNRVFLWVILLIHIPLYFLIYVFVVKWIIRL